MIDPFRGRVKRRRDIVARDARDDLARGVFDGEGP
jgi:hypothetical protein